MLTVAPDVHQLRGFPPNTINCYLVGDVLVDAGTPGARRWILSQVGARTSASLVSPRRRDRGESARSCRPRR
jgi:hypothetical protein